MVSTSQEPPTNKAAVGQHSHDTKGGEERVKDAVAISATQTMNTAQVPFLENVLDNKFHPLSGNRETAVK